jgi:hypothetical protein
VKAAKIDTQSWRHDSSSRVLTAFVQNQRRLALLKRSGLFSASTQGAEIGRAIALEDMRQAFRLVYDSYLDVGYIAPNASGMRIRCFEAVAETATFMAKKEGKVVGVLGLTVDSSDLGLPSDSSFRLELDQLRAKGIKLAEGTNQAILPSFRKTAVTTELMRCGVAQTMLYSCDGIIVSVSPSHSRFYEMLGFHRASGIRSYSSKIHDPVIMMYLSTHAPQQQDAVPDPCASFTREFLFSGNPYNHRVEAWQSEAHRCLYDANLLRNLFVVESDLLAACTAAEREAIRRRWGPDLFAEVVGVRPAPAEVQESGYVPMEAPAAKTRGYWPR